MRGSVVSLRIPSYPGLNCRAMPWSGRYYVGNPTGKRYGDCRLMDVERGSTISTCHYGRCVWSRIRESCRLRAPLAGDRKLIRDSFRVGSIIILLGTLGVYKSRLPSSLALGDQAVAQRWNKLPSEVLCIYPWVYWHFFSQGSCLIESYYLNIWRLRSISPLWYEC